METNTLSVKLHTIFLLVGPSNCGKSTFAEQLSDNLKQILEKNDLAPNVQTLSSDNIRRQMLGGDYNKYDSVMLEASSQAFNVLFSILDNVTQFPVNCYFAIVDTTGLHKDFRTQVSKIADKNHYNVHTIIFNYSNCKDYYKYGCSAVIANHLKKFKTSVLSEVFKEFKTKSIVKSHNYYNNFEISDVGTYNSNFLDSRKIYTIIGDLHCCLDELKSLLELNGYVINDGLIRYGAKNLNNPIVFVGNIVGLGTNVIDTVNFIHKNVKESEVPLLFVQSYNDNSLFKLLSNKESKCYNDTALKLLQNDIEAKEKFIEIYKQSHEFLKFESNDDITRSFFVVHSPCEHKYVGKIDRLSCKYQKHTIIDKTNLAENIKDVIVHDSYNMPYIISGCYSFAQKYFNKRDNRIFLDTGCMYGNKLSSCTIGKGLIHIRFKETFSTKIQTNDLPIISTIKETAFVSDELSAYDMTRINTAIANKINFISGTTSPSGSNKHKGTLESMEKALSYFHKQFHIKNRQMKLSIQPKYMGSRCNIYYFPNDLSKCYSVSRNGFLIKIDMTNIYQKVHEKFYDFAKLNNIKMMLFDSELMPWNALGKDLIESTFGTISTAINTELSKLKKYGFDKKYDEIYNIMKETDIEKDMCTMNKKNLFDKYKANYNTFTELIQESKQHITVSNSVEYYNIYKNELDIYAKTADPHIKLFNILKVVFNNDTESINYPYLKVNNSTLTQIDIFNLVSDDKQCIIDFAEGFEQSINKANEFFNALVKEDMEGVVIKPEYFDLDFASAIKVRNEYYLTMVYGYDYLHDSNYKHLIEKKNIKKKLAVSKQEFALGIEMLKVPYDKINNTNDKLKSLVSKFIVAEHSEKELDPRL